MEEDHDEMADLDNIRAKFMPYQRYIMIVGLIIMIMLVVFLGFAYGSARVCNQLGGFLDDRFKCHLDCNPSSDDPNIIYPGGLMLNLSNE